MKYLEYLAYAALAFFVAVCIIAFIVSSCEDMPFQKESEIEELETVGDLQGG